MVLSLEHVGKTVAGEPHLSDVNLTLVAGTLNVLLGHTGAGKTTLLRIIAGLERPTRGIVRQGGVDITRVPAGKRSVALVYQQFINYPSLSVRDNIASPLRLRNAPNIAARVLELARLLRIEELLDRLPGALSGGQQQRVAIARALAKGAEIVLLDEPLVNLDYKLREDLRDELRALFGTATVVYATTDPAEALALGGHTILVQHGRVLQHAPALEVYHRPASVAAARVFSDPPMNLFDGVVRGGAIELAGDIRIPLGPGGGGVGAHLGQLADGPYCFGIRASDCRVGGAGRAGGVLIDDALPGHVAVRARVELSEISGSETFVYLRGPGEATLIVQQGGVFHHRLDDELTCYLDPDRLLAFDRGGEQPLVASYHPGPGGGTAPAGEPRSGTWPR
jgi:glycerol transport system ATP-binding protein